MVTQPTLLLRGPSLVDRIDPRVRVLAAVVFSIVTALLSSLVALGLALACTASLAMVSGLRLAPAARRLAGLNGVMLLLAAVVPLSVEGTALFALGSWTWSREGLLLAATIALKANAILLAVLVLLATLDLVVLGHALHHFYVPEKLVHLLLFTVRYIDVLEQEYGRLREAMRLRAFRPGLSSHTYRSFGYLIGMLLVRSVDRSERIVAAMKCRGFQGKFWLLDHFVLSWADAWFGAAAVAVVIGMIVLQWRA